MSCEDTIDGSRTGLKTQEPRPKGCVVPLCPDGATELKGCVDEPDGEDSGSVDDEGEDDDRELRGHVEAIARTKPGEAQKREQ